MHYTEDFLAVKSQNFNGKKIDIFNINIDCGYTLGQPRRSGSNEHPQSLFLGKNKKIGIPLHTPVLLYIKVLMGLLHGHVFLKLVCLLATVLTSPDL